MLQLCVLVMLFGRVAEMNKYLDTEKALETIVYIAQKNTDLFHIAKILYYADKLHLENHGTLITGDYYVAMEDGPVPSGAYDLIKYVRGDRFPYEAKIIEAHPEKAIKVVGNEVKPIREADTDYLSESDIECLDKVIKLYSEMDGKKLWKMVHEEESYKKSERNRPIQLRDIISLDIQNGKDILEYLDS